MFSFVLDQGSNMLNMTSDYPETDIEGNLYEENCYDNYY